MKRCISSHGHYQQNGGEEKQRYRRVKAYSLCHWSRVEDIRHTHADRLRTDHIWIAPLELPASVGLGCLGRRTCPLRKVNFSKVRAHGQNEIMDPIPIPKII